VFLLTKNKSLLISSHTCPNGNNTFDASTSSILNRCLVNARKGIFVVFPILIWVFSFSTAMAQIETEAKVKAVSLMPNAAFLTCETSSIALVKGQNQIDIRNISRDVKLANLSFRQMSGAEITSVEIRKRGAYQNDQIIKRIDSLQKIANDSLNWVEFTLKRNEQLSHILYKNSEIEVSDKSIYVDDLDELLIYYKQKLRKLEVEKRKLNYHKNLLVYQIDSLQTAKEKRIATLGLPSTYLRLNISSSMTSSANINFNYTTGLSGWQPNYTILVGEEQSSLQIGAVCYQSTGVNWESTALSLSYGQAEDKNMESSLVQFSSIGDININSNDTIFINSILSQEIETFESFICKPSQSPLALKTVAINGLDGLYLPLGQLKLVSKSGQVHFDSLSSHLFSDSTTYNLGYSNDIIFNRTLSKEKLRKSILGKKKTAEIEWSISFENTSNKVQTILIEDFLPSASKNEVEIDLNLPRGAKTYDDTFTYSFELEPGEKEEIVYGFLISAPKSFDLKDYYKN
jgi:hypothetical protein